MTKIESQTMSEIFQDIQDLTVIGLFKHLDTEYLQLAD